MTLTYLALTAEQREALIKAASQWHSHMEHCALVFPLQRNAIEQRALVLAQALALLQARPPNADAAAPVDPALLPPVLLALREALGAAAAYAELFTGCGVQEPPPAWAIKPDGRYDVARIAATARAALALLADWAMLSGLPAMPCCSCGATSSTQAGSSLSNECRAGAARAAT